MRGIFNTEKSESSLFFEVVSLRVNNKVAGVSAVIIRKHLQPETKALNGRLDDWNGTNCLPRTVAKCSIHVSVGETFSRSPADEK